jgi:hypothetical protein
VSAWLVRAEEPSDPSLLHPLSGFVRRQVMHSAIVGCTAALAVHRQGGLEGLLEVVGYHVELGTALITGVRVTGRSRWR